ncbi:MAG: hypothetical protein IKQ75_08500 [Bacteroidales bacterium]|nr:hypothetical protein [Bacteroidales bacterium]MBR6161891.1 hypothetical protein [Bacteroidales bacterium]
MKRRKIIIISLFLVLLLAVLAELMIYLSAMLDGKYALTEATYYAHLNRMAVALVISNLAILGLLIWVVNKK